MSKLSRLFLITSSFCWLAGLGAWARTPAQNPQPAAAKAVGDVSEIKPGHMTLHTAKGDVQVVLPDGVRVLRGSQDLKTTTPIAVGDINVGDRAVVLGRLGDDQQTINALRVVVMTRADISGVHEAEVRDWQTRGIEGNVKALDPAKLEITLAVPNRPPTPGNLTHTVVVTATAKTTILRYAPNSIKFEDAKPTNFAEIKLGDQLRALGAKNEDGSQYAAEKMVFGTFNNIGATVISVDPQANTLTVKNLATNKPVVVHANADCKMHQLPPFLAAMIARLNSGAPGAAGPPAGGGNRGGAAPPGGQGSPGGGSGGHRGGMSDLSHALENMPAITLNDLKKGDPVVIFSSEGANPSEVTAIFILTGVEPILAAQPKGGSGVNLGSWNLSLGGGGGGEGGGEGGP